MMLRRSTIAIAVTLAFSASHADESESSGKRVDNARVEVGRLPASSELLPAFDYPLPSGLTLREAAAMRAPAQETRGTPPVLQVVLEERSGGALFASGKADLTEASRTALDALIEQLRGHKISRIAIAGHTDSQRLSANARKIFGTNQGLSEARSLSVAAYLKQKLALEAGRFSIAGHGETRPVADNGTPEGMQRNRRVEIQVWFEQEVQVPVAHVPPAPAEPARRAACAPMAATMEVIPFRVTIDGEPVQLGEDVNEADLQRCTDVALEKADIQVRYDGLALSPAMNAWTAQRTAKRGSKIRFFAWSNYIPWIDKAELRIFRAGQSIQEQPVAVLPVDWNRPVEWQAPLAAEDKEVFYLLRAYDKQGRFDETGLKAIALTAQTLSVSDPDAEARENLVGYGENGLVLRNIPVKGGTITVNGDALAPGQTVETLGLSVPVDARGRFVIKQILPPGPHAVGVTVRNPDGTHVGFQRNLTIPDQDWFYIALADLTVGRNRVTGPARLVTGDTQHYNNSTYVDGRGAFYLKGKIKGEYLLTAAADTREGPLKDLFSNFSSKDPRYLLRNIDPDRYYPVFGDDSTTVDDAPTQGKFYVRLEKGDSHVMWGNFKTTWTGTELMQFSRGLYGASLRYRSDQATRYGEQKTQVDAFAADPGTLGVREEHRGTGGSLYYLRQMDVTLGSERVWVEVRDKDSGLVVERKMLTPAQDYEINYLQGRILLRQPLPSTGTGSGLVMTTAVSGNPLYLVVTYEYAPGLTAVDNLSTGGRGSVWLNDHLQIGASAYRQGANGADQTMAGLDATLRYTPGTYLRVEAARSDGAGRTHVSQDGGFGFNDLAAAAGNADAYSVTVAADLADLDPSLKGKIAAYAKKRERGFSAPGQIAFNGEALDQQGVRAEVELRQGTSVELKADQRDGTTQDSSNIEVALRQQIGDEWEAAVGVRRDERQNTVANASPLLSQNGARTDALVKLEYRPNREGDIPGEKEDWTLYGFAQGTLERDAGRDRNDRVGLGGTWRANEKTRLFAEGSDGSMGLGGRLGVDYQLSDRSNVYLAYQLENENPDVAWRGRNGTWVSGASMKVSDQMRVFGETRATHGAGPHSLTQAFGLDLAPNDRWNYGAKAEFGKYSDPFAGDIERRALGLNLGYKYENVKYGGAVEWRSDDGNVAGQRTTWLVRNTLGVQASEAWRLMGKLNFSHSNNSRGLFFDGNYHEFVAAAAYRPVDNDRWNTLFKYTNLHNVPSPGQLDASGAVADYAQRSQVFAIDTIYDVQPWLSVGVKYAFRIGELKATKTNADWFKSRADLLILRADWHFVKEWSAVGELRKLRATEARDARNGFLAAIYRHVGHGVKIGAGYNFTNYSDDLTDLSYRARGWFFNLLWAR